ncbi:MAG: protein kinase, partial [Oscillospiraceae bacterium]|nr:protein kinase [Oscillospiraceae bacterium]
MRSKKFDPRRRLGDGILQMNRKELCALVSELCSRIRSETESGRYHGGIYPENISLNRDGSVAIGPARTSNWEDRELAFIAPELYWDGKATEAADVYSLGLLLYYGVAGKLPFDGESQNSQLTRMSGREITPPVQAGKSLGEVIAKATRYRPSERYQAVEQLQAMVETCLGNRYLNVEDSSQELFHKDDEELSDVERILVSILAEGDEEEKKPLERPTAPAPAASSAGGADGPEETNESILQDIMQEMKKPEEEFTAEFRELELAGAIPSEKPVPRQPFSDEELAALVASVFGPSEPPKPEPPEEPEPPVLPEPISPPLAGSNVVITPVEDIRVYQPNSGGKESAPASGREPIPVLKEDKSPDLKPIVPQTQVKAPLPSYVKTPQQVQQEEVEQRRKRPVVWVLALCALLILA